ncbi:MAG: carboxylesterase/lipase family protein [Lachnospiraceae bacterium]|nr:carboxylesterase/lipase family protein [Lachnospiraceae bacterium]
MSLKVETTSGIVEGVATDLEDKYLKWLGIPYAEPPIGERRFKRAVPFTKKEGVIKCDSHKSAPIQMAGGRFGDLMNVGPDQSEDCLTLNVWSFKGAAKAPVFVFIYGGSQHAGDSASRDLQLDAFSRDGIVAVSFNYRLGVLGFYDFSMLDPSFESNCGISDMIMALKWINENIAAFGGDPGQVTLCGESAGGTAVAALMAAPKARGYFQRAILMSPVLSNITTDRLQALYREKYFTTLGLDPKDVKQLKTLDVSELKKGCEVIFVGAETDTPGIVSPGPVIDDLIPHKPLDAFRNGETADISCMFGTCADEGSLFWFLRLCCMSWEDVESMLRVTGYAYKKKDFHRIYDHLGEKKAVRAINRDRLFWADTMKMAMAQSEHNDHTYMYRYEYETPLTRILGFGSTHTMDICPALCTSHGPYSIPYRRDMKSKRYKRMSAAFHGAFVDFIKTGVPSAGDENWEIFRPSIQSVMHFGNKVYQTFERINPEIYELFSDMELYV